MINAKFRSLDSEVICYRGASTIVSEIIVILALLILIQSQSVTDGQADGRRGLLVKLHSCFMAHTPQSKHA